MKKIHAAGLLFAAAIGFIYSCNKKNDTPAPATTVDLAATLNGANEVPANPSVNTGSVTGTYNLNTKIISINTSWSGFAATNAHIHKGGAGVSGSVFMGFSAPFTSPLPFTATAALTQAQEDSLFAGLFYVNVHSAAYPGGEIRGQLIKK